MSVVVTPPPAASGGGVARNARFSLVFDDYIDPDAMHFGAVLLQSGGVTFDATTRLSFVDHAIEVIPRALLIPQNIYLLSVGSLYAMDGRKTPASGLGIRVGVGSDVVELPAAPPPPTWTEVKSRLSACRLCHSRALGRADMDLDLDGDPRDPIYGIIGVTARSRRDTQTALPRVAPGDGARSVLLRKLVGGDPSEAPPGVTYPALAVDGTIMPPSPMAPLDDETLHAVQAWIDAGALTE